MTSSMSDDLQFEERLKEAAKDPLELGKFNARETHDLQKTLARLQFERDQRCIAEEKARKLLADQAEKTKELLVSQIAIAKKLLEDQAKTAEVVAALKEKKTSSYNRGGIIGGLFAGIVVGAIEVLRAWGPK